MAEIGSTWTLYSITRIVSISEMAKTRPGQVSCSWSEDAKSVQ